MIVWLNGTSGAGKTATAAALVPLIPKARLFDPETVGYLLRLKLADHPVSDFQHWPPWRPLVVATAAELARYAGEHLIAAQTILNRDYLAEIVTGLRLPGFRSSTACPTRAMRFCAAGSRQHRRPGNGDSTI